MEAACISKKLDVRAEIVQGNILMERPAQMKLYKERVSLH